MRRDLAQLTGRAYDLIIVGAGAHGAWAAWDATLRGLKVALVERGDFGCATSANSLKVLHGGFGYLQSLDIARLRLSLAETATLLRLAPRLAQPLPCLLPLRHGLKQLPPLMDAACRAYNLLGGDLARGADGRRLLPKARVIAPAELGQWAPESLTRGARAGLLWHDGLIIDSERLTLAVVQAAWRGGAAVANYVDASEVIVRDGWAMGVRAKDAIGGGELEIRGKAVLVAAGPWTRELAGQPLRQPQWALGCNVVLDRPLGRAAVAVRSPFGRDKDPLRGGRLRFMAPWRGRTMLGTSYRLSLGAPQRPAVWADDFLALLDEFNRACPELAAQPHEACLTHWGLLPLARGGVAPLGGGLSTRPQVRAMAVSGGPKRLFALSPVELTNARALAQRAVDLVLAHLGLSGRACRTARQPLWDEPAAGAAKPPVDLDQALIDRLAGDYGHDAAQVAALAAEDQTLAQPLSADCPVLGCQVLFAVRREMATRLIDVALRRTDLGKLGPPSDAAVKRAAAIMARELAWDDQRLDDELTLARRAFFLTRQVRQAQGRPLKRFIG